MSLFLKNYGVGKDEESFKVAFQIPINCEYTTYLDPYDVNIIAVTLKPYEKDPSPEFVLYEESYTCIDNVLTVDFELPDGNSNGGGGLGDPVTKKPRLRIDDLKMD
ncbi:hypothetical protein GGR22_000182 [Flavobacterium gossypii]|uniref:Uncharacterized protein n=2 Tax=Flavobacterium TaxID=237 RepID=A0A495MIE5_9FLAO|nr:MULTISPECIES: hypothetical protein [Flavobacterium]MBA9072056.1 hypothetical protein [Flavobacterium gossypii]RKS25105.1 hypothetical protein CLV94_0135 [Flavobacterium endophyticum]WDO12550.1 hypothetical protein MH928_14655 [Flavobacterium sp. WW92]